MNKNILPFSFIVWISISLVAGAQTSPPDLSKLSADEVMKRNETARKVARSKFKVRLSTTQGTEVQEPKLFTLWKKIQSDDTHFNSVTRFHSPPTVVNQGIRMIEHPDQENDVMLFLPIMKKTRRIGNGAQSESFMGTAFSYSDIATPQLADFSYTRKPDEACPGSPTLTCFTIESRPKNMRVQERVGYERALNWIRHDNLMLDRADAFRSSYLGGASPYKRLSFSELLNVDKIFGRWISKRIQCEHFEKKMTSIFQVLEDQDNKIDTTSPIPDSTFSLEFLTQPS